MGASHNEGGETRGVRRRRTIEDDPEDEPSPKRRRIEEERPTFLIARLYDEDPLEEEGADSNNGEDASSEKDDLSRDPTFNPKIGNGST